MNFGVTVARTITLLFLSNCFMTAAWYGHLKFRGLPLWVAILASWGLAFFEYLLQVPANRMGYGTLSAYQLKIIQEVISLTVFTGFAFWFLNEAFTVRYAFAFFFMALALAIAFYK